MEHSVDEQNFKDIAQIPVKADNSYTFTHHNPAKGRNFYRIRKINSGKVEEVSHQVTVINPITESWKVESIYPNPSNTFVSLVELSSMISEECTFKLLDLQGNTVFTEISYLEKGRNEIKLQYPKHLKAGAYVLLIQTASQIETHKIIFH